MTCRPAASTDLAAETESRLELRRSILLTCLFFARVGERSAFRVERYAV
jgi:hypothetical protein